MKTRKAIVKKTEKERVVKMKTLKLLFIGMLVVAMATSVAYAAPGGNGRGKGPKKEKKEKTHQPNEKRSRAAERGRKQADLRANLPETANGNARSRASGRRDEHSNRKEDKAHGRDFAKSFEKARWSHNPHDDRGQGNMGKPNMRDPYGHDKDSGREGSERGRPIREDELDLAALLGIEFSLTNPYLIYLMTMLERYRYYAERYPQYSFYSAVALYYERAVNNFDGSTSPYYKLAVNRTDAIDYTLTFSPQEGYEATNLLVTTTLTSVNDYNQTFYRYVYNPETRRTEWTPLTIHYDAGQVIEENTQEMTLGDDNTFSYNADPAANLAGYSGVYTELAITVTEPVSGASYTIAADKQIYMYRCPYGKVTNAKSGESIVGAKVTVHFEDGSIVPLDKASNPTASNPQTTDATGRYGVKLQINRKYYLTAKADGYEDYKSGVFTEKWHVLREDISMTPLKTVASNVE